MRNVKWYPCCAGSDVFTLYNGYKVTRTAFLGTIVEWISPESGLPLIHTRRPPFDTPADALDWIDGVFAR